jgi:hypothetical protein
MTKTGWKLLDWDRLPGRRRFERDFPLVFWFAGLWLFLKSFLCLCYLYMIGLEPPPYSVSSWVEIVYFAVMFGPALWLAIALWNEKSNALGLAIAFFVVDTPLLFFHVLNVSKMGGLESGLTMALEYGSLGLNFVSLGWLLSHFAQQRSLEA